MLELVNYLSQMEFLCWSMKLDLFDYDPRKTNVAGTF